jgi:acyl carrier protein
MGYNQVTMRRAQELVTEALHLPSDQVTPGLAFGSIPQWDSMGHMGTMMLLEERYGITIDRHPDQPHCHLRLS